MPKITFIEHSGTEHHFDADTGQSLMQVAIDNAVPGIDADCGGDCACGTCHVILTEGWGDRVPAPNDDEEAMLSMTPEKTANSRLACQVNLEANHDGMIVLLPEFQM